MSDCPSQEWDRYIDGEERAAAAEVAFYREHRAAIVQVAAALLASGRIDPFAFDVGALVERAAAVVGTVVHGGAERE